MRRGPLLPTLSALVVLATAAAAACGDGDDTASTTSDGAGGQRTTTSTIADAGDLGQAVGDAADGGPGFDPEPVQLALDVVDVPATAPAGNDACNTPTSYDSGFLVDRTPDTAWRMPGDATGQTLHFSLGGPHRVRQVALVPGYAKVDSCDGTDRFAQNRRVTTVTWLFDDGTTATQQLADAAVMQPLDVDATTTTIGLRIDGVTGDPGRDFTAISEVGVRGN